MKWKGFVSTGGEAKHLITTGCIKVNGSVELRRGRKLSEGDVVVLGNKEYIVGQSDTKGP